MLEQKSIFAIKFFQLPVDASGISLLPKKYIFVVAKCSGAKYIKLH